MRKEIILETEMMCVYHGPHSVDISNKRCKELSKKYSPWYPIHSDTIKGFDGKWHYEKI